MSSNEIAFSIACHAAWAPNLETEEAWVAWAKGGVVIEGSAEPAVQPMAPLLRRRAGFLGKMALEVAYRCLGAKKDVPTVFSSRHGEVSRSIGLLLDLARDEPLSPTSFGLSVHNAIGGLFSIARADHASNIALAAGKSGIEHAAIEACGLLAEGEPAVLLVAYDCPLPQLYSEFKDCHEQPYAWACLMEPPGREVVSLTWSVASERSIPAAGLPPGLEFLRFHLRKDRALERIADGRRWFWSRNDREV
ncbi:MAG TPA: beta-ketoacyl synthase chain length factor [Candidatus Binatia bacterium]|nr:beta-ketoacyl synthase chain length factor [Candidatus Binatia bacterium]